MLLHFHYRYKWIKSPYPWWKWIIFPPCWMWIFPTLGEGDPNHPVFLIFRHSPIDSILLSADILTYEYSAKSWMTWSFVKISFGLLTMCSVDIFMRIYYSIYTYPLVELETAVGLIVLSEPKTSIWFLFEHLSALLLFSYEKKIHGNLYLQTFQYYPLERWINLIYQGTH